MDEKTQQLIESLKSNPAAMQMLLMSQDGQELMRMLTKEDRGAALQNAATSAARGDASEMIQLISRVMQSPKGAELIERINRAAQK